MAYKFILFKIFFVVVCESLFSQTIVLDSISATPITENNCSVLIDSSNNLSFSQVLARDSLFRSGHSSGNKEVVKTTWYRFFIKNNCDFFDWFLKVDNPEMYEMDLYSPSSDKSDYSIIEQVSSNYKLFPVFIPKGDSAIFYLKLNSHPGRTLSFAMIPSQTFYERHHSGNLIHAIYFGLLIALTIYNLFVFANTKDSTYIYYVFCIVFIALQIVCYNGYGFQFFWADKPWLNNSNLYCALNILFFAFFTNSFLQVEQYVPRLKNLKWVLIVVTIISLALWYNVFKLVMLVPYILYIGIMGVAVYKKGFSPAKFYLIGYGTFILGILIMVGVEYKFIPLTIFTSNSLQIGSALESLVLSYALADKINFYKIEKETAQKQALDQAVYFSQHTIQAQEYEKKRIANEIQESIGQSLILVKNKLLSYDRFSSSIERSDCLEDIKITVGDTIDQVRSISYSLRPFHMDFIGLTQSLKDLIDAFANGSVIDFEAKVENIDNLLPKQMEIHVYRIIQEYVKNIMKDADMKSIFISIRKISSHIELRLEHWGENFSDNSVLQCEVFHRDLIGIKERLVALNGKLHIKKEGSGIVVTVVQIPLS